MDEATARRLEALIDLGAATALGLAVTWAFTLPGTGSALAVPCGLVALGLAFAILRQVRPEDLQLALPGFDVSPIDCPAELILTDADRLSPVAEELLLDDALPPADPQSRVVRLFDVSAMPTPGELRAHIDRHLAASQSAPPDASQALFDALAQLRSSLR